MQLTKEELSFFHSNLGLVRKQVHRLKWRLPQEPFDDLYQVGCIGLIKSIQQFEPERGNAFSSYAVPKIAGEILHYIRIQQGRKNHRGEFIPKAQAKSKSLNGILEDESTDSLRCLMDSSEQEARADFEDVEELRSRFDSVDWGKHREMAIAIVFSGLNSKQLAEQMGVHQNTVRRRIRRIKDIANQAMLRSG